MENLDCGCQAIRGAGSVRDDVMPGRIVSLLIHPQDNRGVLTSGRAGQWSRDDHLPDGLVEMGTGLRGISEVISTLDNDLRMHVAPGNLAGIALCKGHDTFPIDDEIVFS